MHLEFIKSEFAALLPKHYDPANGTSGIPSHMNDLNREEPTRYVCFLSIPWVVPSPVPSPFSPPLFISFLNEGGH